MVSILPCIIKIKDRRQYESIQANKTHVKRKKKKKLTPSLQADRKSNLFAEKVLRIQQITK